MRWTGICAAAVALAVSVGTASALAAPIQLGVHLATSEPDGSDIDAYTRLVGAPPSIVMSYSDFGTPLFYSGQVAPVQKRGAAALLTWDPVGPGGGIPLSEIAVGAYDGYIREQARLAATWGKPLYVRFAHEMNLPEAAYGPGANGNTPATFVRAWRHVVSLFRSEGATNVRWVWSPNVHCGGRCPFTAFYPGDAWVDWLGLDGYNYAGASNIRWMSFREIFGKSYELITKLSSKPLMIPETASTERGGDKAAWITNAFMRDIPQRFPRIRAVVWFNKVKETDWRVQSSPAALQAFREVARSPLYSGGSLDAAARAIPPAGGAPQPVAGGSFSAIVIGAINGFGCRVFGAEWRRGCVA